MAKQKVTWISEKEAAGMLGYKPQTLRKKVKRTVFINFRSENGRKYQYSLEDIQEYQLRTSTIAA